MRCMIVFSCILAGTIPSSVVSPQAAAARGGQEAKSATRCTLFGTARADHLKGTPHQDVICGLGGADTIKGLAGNDRLVGGRGNDILEGGRGDDVLLGGPGNDRLIGGPGVDRLRGGTGKNLCPDSSVADINRCSYSRSRPSMHPVPPPSPLPQICGIATRPPDECPPHIYQLASRQTAQISPSGRSRSM